MTVGEVCINLLTKQTYKPENYWNFFSGLCRPCFYGFFRKDEESDSNWAISFAMQSNEFNLEPNRRDKELVLRFNVYSRNANSHIRSGC